MKNLIQEVKAGVIGAFVTAPITGGSAALCGYIYAKFNDLPPGPAALTLAVWHIAESALLTIGSTFSTDVHTQKWIRMTIISGSVIAAIALPSIKEKLGREFVILACAVRVIAIIVMAQQMNIKNNEEV